MILAIVFLLYSVGIISALQVLFNVSHETIYQTDRLFFCAQRPEKRVIYIHDRKILDIPNPVPKLKRTLQLGKEEGVNGYEAFLAREKRSEVDSF